MTSDDERLIERYFRAFNDERGVRDLPDDVAEHPGDDKDAPRTGGY